VLLALVVSLTGARAAEDAPAGAPAAPTLSLAECLQLALQRQPTLAAQRASLAAAEDNARALDNLCVPRFLAPDLPIRRQQAALGVTAAAAGVGHVEITTVYAVTRTYYTVVYARQQEAVARGVVERLSALSDAAKTQLKFGAREITQTDVDRTSVYLDLAETRRLEAAEGAPRALAALKEAIGLEPCAPLDVPAGPLPEPQVRPCLQEVVALAVSRRPAVTQADTFAEVTSLEVEAQGSSRRLRLGTFAGVGDIHAREVPPGTRDNEYRPGGVPPEMPTTLVGCRDDRVQRAESFNQRAAALTQKTRDLVALEAEDAFHRWQEAARKLERARRAADTGNRLADTLRKDFTTGQRVRLEEVVNAQVLASQARSQANQFLYEEILALADLERATAGGFCAGLAGPAPVQVQPAQPGTPAGPR
jgi:outer membrane protein TolC